VKNPLRSEAEAFQFLLGAIVYFGLIAIAGGFGGLWWGLGVFVVLSIAAAWWWFRSQRDEEPARADSLKQTPPDVHRVLVVANETVGGRLLRERVSEAVSDRRAEVLVVSPALNSRLHHWVSDEDSARTAARQRLDASLARLAESGISATGTVGDTEPLQAIEDALRTFGADEIIISTHPEGRSHWLEQGLVSRARERFDVPITHVVVDLEAEGRAETPSSPTDTLLSGET
jgi:hypothetical protein